MGTDRSALVVLAAVALVAALIGTTAGGLSTVHLAGSSGGHTAQTPAQQSTGGGSDGRTGTDQSASPQGQAHGWPWLPSGSQAVLIAVLAAIVLALFASLRVTLLRPRKITPGRTRVVVRPEDAEPDEPGETLESLLGEQLTALSEGTPRNAIVAAWVQLEDFAIGHGLPMDPADTPAEFVARALAAYDLDPGAIQRLADLYREARFSSHSLSERHRDEARACLERLTRMVAS